MDTVTSTFKQVEAMLFAFYTCIYKIFIAERKRMSNNLSMNCAVGILLLSWLVHMYCPLMIPDEIRSLKTMPFLNPKQDASILLPIIKAGVSFLSKWNGLRPVWVDGYIVHKNRWTCPKTPLMNAYDQNLDIYKRAYEMQVETQLCNHPKTNWRCCIISYWSVRS